MRLYKPTTPSMRHLKGIKLDFLSRHRTEKGLILPKTSQQGRGSSGRITSRFRGGKGKRLCRNIDFWYGFHGQRAYSSAILNFFHDPTRKAYLALIVYLDGELRNTKRYVIATERMRKGDIIRVGGDAPLELGNILPLSSIPLGVTISCIELAPGKGAQLVRAAGTRAQLVLKDKTYAAIRLPSKEIRLVSKDCFAVLGGVNSPLAQKVSKAKAGRSRWLGRRPKVRGSAMNPVDHPHGGGEGRCGTGRRAPYTPWGKPAFGVPTRSDVNDKLIVRSRKGFRQITRITD